jgi:hypothetical protein
MRFLTESDCRRDEGPFAVDEVLDGRLHAVNVVTARGSAVAHTHRGRQNGQSHKHSSPAHPSSSEFTVFGEWGGQPVKSCTLVNNCCQSERRASTVVRVFLHLLRRLRAVV